MSTQAQIEANKRNCLRSTGPNTPAGRLKSSMNALKHGMRSARAKLVQEHSYACEERRLKWMANADASNDIEEFLVSQNAALSLKLERLGRAEAEQYTSLIEKADDDELDEIDDLESALFFDPCGPTALYGSNHGAPKNVKTSSNGQDRDPNRPSKIVRKLASSAAGCRFLIQKWAELRAHLEREGGFWVASDRLIAIRLLGRQPVDAVGDSRVADIFAASHALRRTGKPFDFLLSDTGVQAHEEFVKDIRERWTDLVPHDEPDRARQILFDLIDQNVEQIQAQLEIHRASASASRQTSGCTSSADLKLLPNQPSFSSWPFILCPVANSPPFHSPIMPSMVAGSRLAQKSSSSASETWSALSLNSMNFLRARVIAYSYDSRSSRAQIAARRRFLPVRRR